LRSAICARKFSASRFVAFGPALLEGEQAVHQLRRAAQALCGIAAGRIGNIFAQQRIFNF
jgi:hypothetical protein